jgi:ATP-binding cassette subfamily B protein
MFSIAIKSIAFAWQTNRRLLILLMVFNIFQGAVVYLQFTSFASIVDEIIKIKQGTSQTSQLVWSAVLLGLSFLVPLFVGNIASHYRMVFRMQQSVQLELYKIERLN